MEKERTHTKGIHRLFIISLILKAINAVLEILGSVVFLFSGAVTGVLTFFAQNELAEDPGDVFANFVNNFVLHLSAHSQLFIAAYLFIHGFIKILLIIGLLSRRIWVYKAAIWVLFAFIVYQLYEYALTRSLWLIGLSIFDAALIWLTWREHQAIKNAL